MNFINTPPGTVLISGAGIAGLALAYEFDRLKIPFVIVEQDPQANFRNQGYGLKVEEQI